MCKIEILCYNNIVEKDTKMLLIEKTRVEISPNGKGKYRYGMFKCPTCNSLIELHIQNGKKSKECRSCASTKHGMSSTRQYHIWQHMMQRTSNPQDKNYAKYSDKIPDKKWHTFEGFWKDMESGYEDNLELDRRDNLKGYSKSNCRWVNKNTQQQNKGIGSTNTSGYKGASKCKGRYTSRCQANGVLHYLGSFDTAKEAGIAYDTFVIKNGLQHELNFKGDENG